MNRTPSLLREDLLAAAYVQPIILVGGLLIRILVPGTTGYVLIGALAGVLNALALRRVERRRSARRLT